MDTVESGLSPVYFCSAHCTEMLLKTEVPLVFSAFHMSGFAASQVIPGEEHLLRSHVWVFQENGPLILTLTKVYTSVSNGSLAACFNEICVVVDPWLPTL